MKEKISSGEKPKMTDRRERWRVQVKKVLAEVSANQNFIEPDVFEEVEGRDMVDVILDRICDMRGVGVKRPDEGQSFESKIDTWYEREAGSRRMKEHDHEVARFAVYHFLMVRSPLNEIGAEFLRRFIVAFYRPGDYGLFAAERRAILKAIGGDENAR